MKNLSLNKKIVGLQAIFVIASFIIAFVGISKVMSINDNLNDLFKSTNKRVLLAKDMDSLFNQIRNKEKVVVLVEDHATKVKEVKSLDDLVKKVYDKIDEYMVIASAEGKKDLSKLKNKLEEWKEIDLEIRSLTLAEKDEEASDLAIGKSREKLEALSIILNSMVERNEKFMNLEMIQTGQLVENTRILIIAVSIISLLIGGVLSYTAMKMINTAIDKVISNLNDSSLQVASAASQIASSSEELSQSTTEQASSLEETASSVEEMSSMINKNSENARVTSENSNTSQMNAVKGRETVNEMIRSIDEINESNNKIMDQINQSNAQLADIVKVITAIGSKTKIINEIVFQTKLLSFNASVEAARAGEHGKGFAVVAEEVGNLAQVSGNASKEISTMLDESILKVERIVNETKFRVEKLIAEGKEKVENGTRIAQSCGHVLEEIVSNISQVTDLAGEISTASSEQSQGISEINKAMQQLDQVTQQNAAASEQAAKAAEDLSVQAQELKNAVSLLVTTIKGKNNNGENVPTSKIVEKKKSNVIKMTDVKKEIAVTKNQSASLFEIGSQKTPAPDDLRFKDV